MADTPQFTVTDLAAFLERNRLATPSEIPHDPAGAAGLDWGALDAATAGPALQAHRRLYHLSGDVELSGRLLQRGLGSAAQVAMMPAHAFVREHAEPLGLSGDEARAVHRRAVGILNRSMHLFASIAGTVASPHFQAMRVSNVSDEAAQHFQDLPSYQELFGSLDYCACPECKSMLGPAAYFVDLMRIVDEYVTKPNQATIPPALTLDARRPDLAGIPLTCAATNDTLPYLEIVNQRLVAALQQPLGVKDQADLLFAMATSLVYPLALPYHDPLARIRVLVQAVGLTLAQVYATWRASPAGVVHEALGQSLERAQIVTRPAADASALAAFYGVTAADLSGLAQVPTFLNRTGLTVPALQALVVQEVTPAEIAAGVPQFLYVNQGLGTSFLGLSYSEEGEAGTIDNLNNTALDQLNRLRRLADPLGWPAPVTDWVLRAVQNGGTPALDEDALARVARVKRVSDALALPPLQASFFFGPIKSYGGDGLGGASPFDQLFNGPAAATQSGSYHPAGNPLNPLYTDPPLSWTPGDGATTGALVRVSAGLGLSLDAATLLGTALYGTTAVQLTVEALSALYRHALLSRAFNLPTDRYLLLLKLAGLEGVKVFAGEDLDALIHYQQWAAGAGMDAYQIAYVALGVRSPFVDPLLDPAQVAPWLGGLVNTVPSDAPDAADKVAAQVAVFFGVDMPLLTPALGMALQAVPPPAGLDWWKAFLAPIPQGGAPPYAAYVTDVLQWVARWLVLSRAAGAGAELLGSVFAHPALYGVTPGFTALTPDNVRDVQSFAAAIARYRDVRGNLVRAVDRFAAGDDDGALEALAAATGWDPAQVRQIMDHVLKDTSNAVHVFLALEAAFAQLAALGSDTAMMRDLRSLADEPAASGWTRWNTQAQGLAQKVAARFGRQAWPAVSGQVEGRMSVGRRDALLGLELNALESVYADVTTPDNVYEFLLTDVLIGPEAQISYLKEGLNAVQLYLQRCRLRLEPGVRVLDVPEVWWEWMMNYRVWEANRKIFLYPENYLLPPLRHDKTALFRKLEDDLQQSEVTPLYVEGAYTTYIDSLYKLARVVPVEAFHGEVSDPARGKVKALFLVGRSETEPYTFHLCSQLEGSPWSEWQQIQLDIVSPYVTLAYAFSKLFIFWVQLDRVTSPAVSVGTTGGQTDTNLAYRATLRYSFQDRAGRWVQPQTLAQEQVVFFAGQGPDVVNPGDPALYAGVFDMAALPWQKVFAVRADAANLAAGLPATADAERLVVMYGAFLNDTSGAVGPATTASTNPDAVAFAARATGANRNHTRVSTGLTSGALPFWSAYALDSTLETAVLVHRWEFVLPDPSLAASPVVQFRADVNQMTGAVQRVVSGTPVTDLYLADGEALTAAPVKPPTLTQGSFVSDAVPPATAQQVYLALKTAGVLNAQGAVVPSALPALNLFDALGTLLGNGTLQPVQLPPIQAVLFGNAGAPVLFGAVADRARTLTVKNQPGWFMLNNGDEAFLLRPDPGKLTLTPVFSTLEDGLLVSGAVFNPASFVIPNGSPVVGYDIASQVFSTLQTFAVLDAQGVANPATVQKVNLATLLGNLVQSGSLSTDQVTWYRHALLNFPMVFPESFELRPGMKDVSALIYSTLQSFGIIDGLGRVAVDTVTGPLLNTLLGNMLDQGQITQRDVVAVYRILLESPVPVAFTYLNQGDPSGFAAAGQFQVTRLTTAAVQRLERALFVGGIERLLSLDMQNIPVVPIQPFSRLQPSSAILWPEAIDGAQVDFDGLYGRYFWELYYHGPMLVANSLAANGQFRDALSWFQYVFNPTLPEQFVAPDSFYQESRGLITTQQSEWAFGQLQSHDVGTPAAPILSQAGRVNPAFTATTALGFLDQLQPAQQEMVRNVLLNYRVATPASRFWQFRPFRNHTLESLTEMLSDGNPAVMAYNDDPFDPFAIARLRIGAFEKATVMQYVDTLLLWGDFYFAQDTWETITAATLLYVYASDLLGPRPQQVGVCSTGGSATFADIRARYAGQPIPQFLIYLETILPPPGNGGGSGPAAVQAHGFNDLGTYFCVPENSLLTSYWDRVEDRLFKIRHSMNIQGQVRTLALFEPPLDPLALIRAAGASNNVVGAGQYGDAGVPPYRFRVALERAKGLAAVVSQLGGELLAALQNNDGEALSLLRNTQEGQILALTTQLKQYQIDEANDTVAASQAAADGAQERLTFYTDLLDKGLLGSEQTNLDAMAVSLAFNLVASVLETAAAIGYAVPQVGSPFAMTYGGIQLGSIVQASAGAAKVGAEISNYIGQRALTMAGYERRTQEWTLQKLMATHDLDGAQQALSAARVRVSAATQDLVVHQRGIAQNQEMDDFLRDKFTSQALYQWMGGRLSALYFQTYRLALEASLTAQRAYQFELGRTDSFIDLDYWDTLRKGLLAGDGLRLALDRMEAGYGAADTRALEIERTVSLVALDPQAFETLRTSGRCTFGLPEALFDYDYPGHYQRKLKNVSLSVPAVVGPYENIRATLTQTSNVVALDDSLAAATYLLTGQGTQPTSLRYDWANRQQVAISRGVDDSGLFQLDFHDDRYLPFEGTGAVSSWTLEMPLQTNRFDFSQLTDVVLTLRYTARASESLRGGVEQLLAQHPLSVGYYVNARQQYPVEWSAFMQDHANAGRQTLGFTFTPAWQGYVKSLVLQTVLVRVTADVTWPATPVTFASLSIAGAGAQNLAFSDGIARLDNQALPRDKWTGSWRFTVDLAAVKANPALAGMLDPQGEWLSSTGFSGVELILLAEATVF